MKKLSIKAKKIVIQRFINVFDEHLKDSYISFSDLEFLSVRKISKLIKLSSKYSDVKSTRRNRMEVAHLIKSLHGEINTRTEINKIVNNIVSDEVYKIIEDVVDEIKLFATKLIQILILKPNKQNEYSEDIVIRLGILRI